jgi:hypothetical protein
MNIPPAHFGAEFNPDMVHLLPTIFLMRGEHEDGTPAGLMLAASFLGLTVSVVWC